MNHGDETAVRILRRDAATLVQTKDEEYDEKDAEDHLRTF